MVIFHGSTRKLTQGPWCCQPLEAQGQETWVVERGSQGGVLGVVPLGGIKARPSSPHCDCRGVRPGLRGWVPPWSSPSSRTLSAGGEPGDAGPPSGNGSHAALWACGCESSTCCRPAGLPQGLWALWLVDATSLASDRPVGSS